MNRYLKLAMLLLPLAAAAPAFAADQAQYQINGSLAQACRVTAPPNQIFDPASTAVQPIGSPSYVCNFAGNATLRFWTQNGGQVVSPAAASNNNVAQSRPYTFVFDGSSLGQLTNASGSSAPLTRTIVTPNVAQNGASTMQLGAAATVAGTYSDTIFVSIAP